VLALRLSERGLGWKLLGEWLALMFVGISIVGEAQMKLWNEESAPLVLKFRV
jgi:hypothetical protein